MSRFHTFAVLATLTGAAASLSASLAACNNSSSSGVDPRAGTPPPPAPSAAASNANLCAGGGDEVKDKVSAPFLARKAGSYCIRGDAKTYGSDGAKYTVDEVCTTAVDGECEVYKGFGFKRYVSVRYVDGSGKPNTIDVGLWQFADAGGAYGMFTKRVIADGDPLAATTKPLAGAGGAASIGGGNSNVWKGQYLVELTFNSEDATMTRDQMSAAAQAGIVPIATAIGNLLPGSADLIPPAKALPAQSLIPLGIDYQPKDALGFKGAGAAAVGYYKEGAKRWRMVAMTQGTAAQAGDAFRAIRASAGAQSVSGIGDEATTANVDTSAYVFARKGSRVLGVGDESFGDDAAKITQDEKVAKLNAWLASSAPPAPAPATSAPAKH